MKIPSPMPFIKAHWLLLSLILLAIALSVGGYQGWKYYQHTQTSDYAFQSLQKALAPPVPEELAKIVDFRTLSGQLARATASTFPFYHNGPDQLHILREKIQSALLEGFKAKQELTAAPERDEQYAENMLKKDLILLQPDFMPQFIKNLKMKKNHPDNPDAPVLLTSSVRHDQLNVTFPFILSMVKGKDGWVVRDLVNADALLKELRKILISRLNLRQNLVLEKNKSMLKRMNDILPIQSCTVGAGLLSDQSTLLVVVHVLARNSTHLNIYNFNLGVSIQDAQGQEIMHRFLNAAEPVHPGEDLNRRWTIELDGASPQGQKILQAGKLRVKPQWQSMTLSSSEVLHLYDVPDIMKKCPLPEHDHPMGLCTSPIFVK